MTDTEDARLYLLLPPRFEPESIIAPLAEALAAVPVACVRFDLGPAPEEDWIRAANHLMEPCHEADVALVVTDHYRLVDALGLDGVHLATIRTPVRDIRKALGPDRIIGAWAGASRHQALVLAEAGVDYVSLGPVGDTGALGDDSRAEDELFEWWAQMIETPCVAEGGMTPEHTARLAPHADFVVPDPRIWEDPATLVDTLRAHVEALGTSPYTSPDA